jgi:hypothetical protein
MRVVGTARNQIRAEMGVLSSLSICLKASSGLWGLWGDKRHGVYRGLLESVEDGRLIDTLLKTLRNRSRESE